VDFDRVKRRIDAFQQRHRPLAFAVGVQKKFGEDEGGNLCALLTYYGFVSLFPLLLVFFSVLGFVLEGNPSLQHQLRDSALSNLPIIGDQIASNVTSVQGSGLALVVGLLGALWGGLGIANAAQDAMNRVWGVDRPHRPGFVPRVLRSLGLVGTLGAAVIATAVLSAAAGYVSGNLALRAVALVVSIAANVAVFLLAFKLLTARDLAIGTLLPGALVAAVGFEVLQVVSGAYVGHALKGMSATYGMFAIVLGALAWIFLQARVVVYAAEVNVVRHDRLWPRALVTATNDRGDTTEDADADDEDDGAQRAVGT